MRARRNVSWPFVGALLTACIFFIHGDALSLERSLSQQAALVSRRNVLEVSSAATIGAWFLCNKPAGAEDEVVAAPALPPLTVPRDKSVLVLGANGQTGTECVRAALALGRRCIATSRSGVFNYADQLPSDIASQNLLSTASVDVSSLESIQAAVNAQADATIGAMIFAASIGTGKSRPEAFAVDCDGLINAAKCCIANKIPRLVVVSSGSVTRPDSAVFKLLNFLGSGIMEAKIQGEDGVRGLYAAPEVLQQNLGYTIIRPGGLTVLDAPLGSGAIELNQGDTKSGRLSRADVAALCIQALDLADTFDTTFECYEKVTAKPIESVGFSNILKSTKPTEVKLGTERQGDTYEELFRGLQRDPRHILTSS